MMLNTSGDKVFLWLDCEMTGLDVKSNTILEVAAVMTDSKLRVIGEIGNLVVQHSQEQIKKMDHWCTQQHTKSGLVNLAIESTFNIKEVEQLMLRFIIKATQKTPKADVILCGNSIWNDRKFLSVHMPLLEKRCHYRMLDVTSIRIWLDMIYSPVKTQKAPTDHRALSDAYASLEEFKQYIIAIKGINNIKI